LLIKEIAAIRDAAGWFFIGQSRHELNHQPGLRFASVKPYYNGQLFVRLLTGQRATVDEMGRMLQLLPKATSGSDAEFTTMVTTDP
jgi:hypothetical protein